MKSRSIKKKIIKVTLVAMVCLVVSILIFGKYCENKFSNALATSFIEAYGKNLSNAIYVDLVNNNHPRLYQVVSRFYDGKITETIKLIDKNGAVIVSVPDNSNLFPEDKNVIISKTIYSQRGKYIYHSPIYLMKSFDQGDVETDNIIGYLDVVYVDNLLLYPYRIATVLFIVVAITVLLFALFVILFFYKFIVRYFFNLLEKIKEHFKNRTPISCEEVEGYVDFDNVINAANDLLVDIKNSEKRLAEEARFVSLGQSTAMVAHDVRKPLTSMKALLVSLTKIKDDPAELNKMISAVDRNIAHTNAMLEDILDFSRDSTALKLGKANPQGLVVSALSDVFRNHTNSRVNVIYDLKHLHTLECDSDRIIRVLANIIGNGIEAVSGKDESCGVEIKVGTYEAEREGKKVIGITIADNGPGIPENILPKLFDPFFTHGKKGGTGLGLAICQRIIALHGGKIEARNRNDAHGAEFVIELPAGEGFADVNESELIHNSNELKVFREEEARRIDYGDTANAAEFMRINKERGRESYLLIVDDEPLFRETVRGLFSDLGQVKDHVKVVETDSAEKALEMFKAREFDYVIADIDLGKGRLNGYEFSQMILKRYPNTHVLIHSNKRRAELDKDVREIKSDKFIGFLPKPMRADELLQFLACKTFEVEETKAVTVSEKKKILVLNDDDTLLFSFKMLLKAPDVQVLTASNVSTAFKHIAEQKVDVILSDVNLGEGEPDGYEFLKNVRETDKTTPFYMVSGYSAAEEGPKAKDLGANGYLQLPVDQKQLRDLI